MADFKPFAGAAQEETGRPLLRRIVAVLSLARNALGQLRVSVDNTPNINNVASVTTVTTVSTVTTVGNSAAVGGYSAAMDQLYAGRSARAAVRGRIG
jgi:hypothetical protein